MRRGLGDEDGIVDPDDGVEGLVVEAPAEARRLGAGSLAWGGGGPAGVGPARVRRAAACQKALDSPHEGVEGGARVALSEVSRSKAAHEAVDAEAAHSLVAEPEASVRVTSHDQAPTRDDAAVFVDGVDAGPGRFAGAPAEDAEVVSVLQVLGKHNITAV